MDFDGTARLAVGAVPVFGYVQDLATYPQWFSIVDRATPTADVTWDVDLAAKLGPFKRTKRVRMMRVELDAVERQVRFERRELDGREHSAWVLDARVEDDGTLGCRLQMHVHYGTLPTLPGIDIILREEAKRAGGRLERLLQSHGHLGL